MSGTTTSYTYNADGQRLTSTQGGSTITSGTWNGAGQLASYTSASGSMASPVYDGGGLRASATFTPYGGSPVTESYVWDLTADVPALLMDSANAYIYLGNGAPAEQVNLATGVVTYLVTDALGSVRGTVSSSGALTGTTSYDAWGNPASSGGLTATTPFGFAGGYTDPTGLIYLLNRYYDPATGQFTSLDPMVDQTLQPYAYTAGDPVSQSDPAGLQIVAPGGGGDGGGGGGGHHRRHPSSNGGTSSEGVHWWTWFNYEHRLAVYASIFQITVQLREDYGLSPAQIGDGFLTEHYIYGVSKKRGRVNGKADITFAMPGGGAIYVWEVKAESYGSTASAEAALYVRGLQAANRNGQPGFALQHVLLVPTVLGILFVHSYGPGGILYARWRTRTPAPTEEPVYEPAPEALRAAIRAGLRVAAGAALGIGLGIVLLGVAEIALA